MSLLINLAFLALLIASNIYSLHPAYEYEESVSSTFDKARYSDVIPICEQGLEIRPDSITMLNLCGQSLFILKRYDESKKLFLKLLKIGNLQNSPVIKALAYNNMGEIYRIEERWDGAKKHYEKALSYNKKKPDKLAANIYNLGKLYKDMGVLDEAEDNFSKVIKIKKAEGLLHSLAYNELGLIYEKRDEYWTAEEFYKDSLLGFEKEGLRFYIGIVHGNIGRLYLILKDYENALVNLQKALDYGRKVKDNYGIIKRLRHLAMYYTIHKDYKKSALYLEESISIKDELGEDTTRDKLILSYLKGE